MNWKKLSAAALAAMTVTIISAAPVLAAEDIPVNDDISVSGDYDWTRFAGDQHHAECLQQRPVHF